MAQYQTAVVDHRGHKYKRRQIVKGPTPSNNAGQIRTSQRARFWCRIVSWLRPLVWTYLQASLENLNRHSQKELTLIGQGGENISRNFAQNSASGLLRNTAQNLILVWVLAWVCSWRLLFKYWAGGTDLCFFSVFIMCISHCKTQYRKFETNIPKTGIVRPQY